jgi:hypothetical protein
MFNLDDFKSNFANGARQYLFYVKPTFPNNIVTTTRATYLAKSASLPNSSFADINLGWQGYSFKFAGRREYSEWNCTFNLDNEGILRTAFEEWQRKIQDPTSNIQSAPSDYFKDQTLELLNNNGVAIMTYKLVGAWPKTIGETSLDYEQNGVATMQVTFTYMYHVMKGSTTPSYGVTPNF